MAITAMHLDRTLVMCPASREHSRSSAGIEEMSNSSAFSTSFQIKSLEKGSLPIWFWRTGCRFLLQVSSSRLVNVPRGRQLGCSLKPWTTLGRIFREWCHPFVSIAQTWRRVLHVSYQIHATQKRVNFIDKNSRGAIKSCHIKQVDDEPVSDSPCI